MRCFRVAVCFLLLFCSSLPLTGRSKRLTVMGTLTEVPPLSAETSGWSIQLNPVIMVNGQQITFLEIKSSNPQRLESLEDKFVQATGTLTFTSSSNSVRCPVLELSSIKEHHAKGSQP